MSEDLKVVQTFNSEVEAEMARGLLEAEGIQAMVLSDDCGGMYPQFQELSKGVRLLVAPAALALAREILGVEADQGGPADGGGGGGAEQG